ncbi:MAG: DNA-processing protein DprA [Catonella sp.]|uniref:DNA-processing protein DprA n=1 Tax=Catonella sp. TaxID=2382125 RepID=UPI003F9F9F20
MREELLMFWLSLEGHTAKIKYDILVANYGSLYEAYEAISKGKCTKIKGMGERHLLRLKALSDKSEIIEKYEKMLEKGIKYINYFDKAYPDKLRNICSAPIGLFYKGELPNNKEKIISVVGSRDATEKGLYYARKMSEELSDNGVSIVSGMALGIDSAAHLGALQGKKGRTYAVLGCGVDVCYPFNNIELYLKIIDKGAVISEFPMGVQPMKANFPQRNRIISGISDGVFVVEAREKSGSLITADMGLEQGKNIYALPGRSEEPLSRGTNKLIQFGAKLVNDVNDILEDFDFPVLNTKQECVQNLTLESGEKIVYATLCLIPKHISEILAETGLDEGELFKVLLGLEFKGYVRRTSFEYYIAVPLYI